MRFLANENLPFPSIELLRAKGLYVYSVLEESPGITDLEVITVAQTKDLIILTLDKDYGEIIFKYAMSNPPSVVYFRDKGNNPLYPGTTLIDLLTTNEISLNKMFTVIDKDNIRQRKY